MADVTLNSETSNPKELLNQGIRAYVLQDFTTAVSALSKVSELLVTEHSDDLHDSLGDVYLYYGKALLGLSRQEGGPLGDAIPKGEDDEDSGNDEEVEEENEEAENGEEKADKEKEDKPEVVEKSEAEAAEKTTDDVPSSSNGATEEPTEEPKEEDEEPTDLQVAWEVLELAKKIFQNRGETGQKQLAECMNVLGEISVESENFEAAVSDFKQGLEIQEKIYSKDNRTLAETCYNLGIALVFNTQMEDAAVYLKKSFEILKNRIAILEKEDTNDAKDEIKEINGLIPELEAKILEISTYKDEALKALSSLVKENQFTSGSSSSTSSTAKAADISHLVKRKRKPEETTTDEAVACKKVTP